MKKVYHLSFTVDTIEPEPVPEPRFQDASQLAIALEATLRHRYGFEAIRAIEPSKRGKGARHEKASL